MSQLKKSAWGPALWTMLHVAASTTRSREDFLRLLHAVRATIPCEKCKAHIDEYFAARPPEVYIGDSSACSNYVYHMHSAVRERLGQEPRLSPEEYLELYDAAVTHQPPPPQAQRQRPTQRPTQRLPQGLPQGPRAQRFHSPADVAYRDARAAAAPPMAFRPRVAPSIYGRPASAFAPSRA